MPRKKAAVQIACGQHVNSAASPEDLHKLLVQALNSGDLDALVALYALDGFLLARSGPARGIGAIRKALAEYVAMKPTLQLTTRRVVQAGTRRCLWQTGDFTEPPPMAAMWQPLERVSKWLVVSRMGIGATSFSTPDSVNGLGQVLGSSASDHALTTACCESMRRN